MRIIYAGSPAYAVPALEKLLDCGADICGVITRPDRPVGRKRVVTPTPVKAFALSRGLKVLDYEKINEHTAEISSLSADIMITCAYGQILSRGLLSVFPLGVWNLHASLLPKFRGASPIQSAVLAGEEYTGVTVMRTEPELDTGDILLVKRCPVGNKSYGELEEELSRLSADAAVEAVEMIASGDVRLLMQNEAAATYCGKIKKEDAKIDFSRPAREVLRLVRASDPQPLAYCTLNGSPVNIVRASEACGSGAPGEVIRAESGEIVVACKGGAISIETLQPAGGKIQSARDFLNGRKIKAGDVLE